MADTNTSPYDLTLPQVGASADTWGTKLNDNLEKIDNLLDGTLTVQGVKLDSDLTIVDITDDTKVVTVNVAGVTASTTRTWTFPDASDTFVGLAVAQTLTNKTLDAPVFENSEVLKANEHDTLTTGFDSTVEDLGTVTGGTITPEVDAAGKQNFKTLTNNGSFTLAPPSTSSACSIRLRVINAASAGTIITTGFDTEFGDSYATTANKEYWFFIDSDGTRATLAVKEIL